MSICVSGFPLQRLILVLPKPLRRIKVAQFLAALSGTPYHRVEFSRGELIGNLRDREVANSLVRGAFADYGYFDLAAVLLSAGDVHVDVGANYGFHSFGVVGFPTGATIRYFLIDANPDCVACLGESAKLHPGVEFEIVHAAAAADAGEVGFRFSPAVTGAGYVGEGGSGEGVVVRVPTVRLEDLLAEHGIQQVKLMKVDIEGSEVLAMRGLAGMLSAHRVDAIYFEVNPACLARQKKSPPELFAEFTRHGYRLCWPHEGVEWISRTFGGAAVKPSDLRRWMLPGDRPYVVAEFEEARYREGSFGQCDLLAVSPKCGLREA